MTSASRSPHADRSATVGAALCLASAAGFGAMAIFGKLAYEADVGVSTLLLVRFTIAGLIFGALIGARPQLRARRTGRRAVLIGLGLGAIGYALQSRLFFDALERLDASLLALLLYTYPAWVTLAAFALGRERPTRRRLVALALSSIGLVIVLTGAAGDKFDTTGALMGVGAALAYTAYILVADRAGIDMPPLELSALVCAGATATFAILGVMRGELDFGFEAEGWIWLAAIAVVSTVTPIVLFFAGLRRVGPSMAAILSTLEPPTTVALAFIVFGESLTGLQLAGAALVLGAAVSLNLRPRRAAGPLPA